MRKLIYIITGVLILISCEKPEADDPTDQGDENNRPKNLEDYNATSDGLRDYFAEDGYFDIGVAIEPRVLDVTEEVDLIIRHMNSLTAENAMKWSSIEPFEGSFNWTGADRIVDFASINGMKVRGHTLCWHNQVPDWIFQDNGSTASKELVLERLRNHISAVVGRYKGKVYAWDVVNEAIDDGGGYRNNTWYAICGKIIFLKHLEQHVRQTWKQNFSITIIMQHPLKSAVQS